MYALLNQVEGFAMSSMKNTITDEFKSIIDLKGDNENKIQAFLESNSEFIPIPTLENHRLHLNSVLCKMPIGERVTDFAYITKSSDEWVIVLIELESSNKRIFTKSSGHVGFSAKFNDAVAQIDVWREYLSTHSNAFKELLAPLLVPPALSGNKIRFEYVLVIGRSSETDHNQARKDKIQQLKSDKNIHVLNYDSLIKGVSDGRQNPKALLKRQSGKYHLISVQAEPTHMFTYIMPQHLSLSSESEKALVLKGYEISAWKDNTPLDSDWGRTTKSTFLKQLIKRDDPAAGLMASLLAPTRS